MNIQLPHRSQTRLGHYINDVQSDIGSFSTSPPNLKVKPPQVTGLIVGTAQIPGACCEVVLFRIYNALHIVEILKNLFCPVQRRNRIWRGRFRAATDASCSSSVTASTESSTLSSLEI